MILCESADSDIPLTDAVYVFQDVHDTFLRFLTLRAELVLPCVRCLCFTPLSDYQMTSHRQKELKRNDKLTCVKGLHGNVLTPSDTNSRMHVDNDPKYARWKYGQAL